MKNYKYYRPVVYFFTLTMTSLIAIFTVTRNLDLEVYRVDQDSIGLPIGVIICTLLMLTIAELAQMVFRKNNTEVTLLKHLLAGLSLALSITSLIILTANVIYWCAPDHLTVSVLYGITAVAFIGCQLQLRHP